MAHRAGTIGALLNRPSFVPLGLIGLFIALALWRLDAAPALWWDEGWTLCNARSWVEIGHYGCLLAGEPAPGSLAAAFPVVASIALGFRLLGVGIWQARLVGVLYTAGALALLYYLAGRLFSRRVAVAALVILFLMPNAKLHPVYLGKQVLAEMPAVFFLLAGYALFYLAFRRSLWLLTLALGFWGIALMTKAQVLPFWAVSLLLPLVIALQRQRWRAVVALSVGMFGSYGAFRLLLLGQQLVLDGHTLHPDPVSGLYNVTALVLYLPVRLAVLRFAFVIGLPLLLGLGYAAWEWVRKYWEHDLNDAAELLRLMLFGAAGSWFAWYAFLSFGWTRYLFPAVFLGSPYVAALFSDLTNGYDLPITIRSAALALREKRPAPLVKALTGISFLLVMILFAAGFFVRYFRDGDTSLVQVSRFLNTATPTAALIETYDSELFLLLDRPYHYPPAQVHVELSRRTFLDQDVSVDYDPLAMNPEYLVVGPISRMWGVYEPVLTDGAFHLVQTYGSYEVYERVR